MTYECTEQPKSDLYRELMPLLNSRNVELLDHPRMAAQFVGWNANQSRLRQGRDRPRAERARRFGERGDWRLAARRFLRITRLDLAKPVTNSTA